MQSECCREDANGTHAPCGPYADLQDENEQLRAALEKIVAIEESADVPAPCHIRAAAAAAREALK